MNWCKFDGRPIFLHLFWFACGTFSLVASFYTYGSSAGDTTVTQGDDGCPLTLDFGTTIFGIPRDQVYVRYLFDIYTLDPSQISEFSQEFDLATKNFEKFECTKIKNSGWTYILAILWCKTLWFPSRQYFPPIGSLYSTFEWTCFWLGLPFAIQTI